ncbi:Nuclear protein X1 isoform 3 [Cucumis melo var. makuwa]|uniref:Nuclear protein X1 isoform 3 n=2 Tax=Cucumis melo TaxID=3656 RepID=A0A5A7UA68_CUCMM|nr:Nuclear protein X1 isoform 3 [Cucumis melo var. makuwa]TYK01819.1 Nuclear protein X1 isoform 3 [Cucumis melo var. makuwa]
MFALIFFFFLAFLLQSPNLTLQEIRIFPTPKNVGEVKNTSGKDLPTQSSASRQTSGEVSRDRLSRSCVGQASGKPLPTPSFPMQSTTSGKPRLLSRRHVLRRKSLPRQALPCSFVEEPFCRHYIESSRKALEKGDKRDPEKVRMEREELERQQREGWRRATNGGRLKLKLQSRRRTAMTIEGTIASYGKRRIFLSSSNSFPFVFSFV